MKYRLILAAALILLMSACSSRRQYIGSSDRMVDLTAVDTSRTVNSSNAEEILRSYIIDFSIPNPLFGNVGGVSGQNNDPSHESSISCRAVLLDEYSTEADIVYNCLADSLDSSACETYRADYTEHRVRDGLFRIMLAMESGFSDKSMEPDLWAFYLETPDGVMLEPVDVVTSPVVSLEDSIYMDYYRRNMPRRVKTRNITFYFDQTTFYGKELLSGELPYLVFVISRERRTVARLAWKLGETQN